MEPVPHFPAVPGSRVGLKIAFRQMCVTLCGRFGPDEGGVAGYVDQIGTKYAAKWGVQMAGMNFQTRSRENPYNFLTCIDLSLIHI